MLWAWEAHPRGPNFGSTLDGVAGDGFAITLELRPAALILGNVVEVFKIAVERTFDDLRRLEAALPGGFVQAAVEARRNLYCSKVFRHD